jgi:hypothetical protein
MHRAWPFCKHVCTTYPFGKVTTQAGEPLPGATIYCYELSKGTFSDSMAISNSPIFLPEKLPCSFHLLGMLRKYKLF